MIGTQFPTRFAPALIFAMTALMARATPAHASPRLIPSLRLAIGGASVERSLGREPGFTGQLDLGLTLVGYTSATDVAPSLDALADMIVPPGSLTESRGGFIARVGFAYDRTGPGNRAARDFALTAQAGYGYSILQACVGTAFLTGRVEGARARGVRLDALVSLEYGIAYVDIAHDFWFLNDAHVRDFRVLVGMDVLALGWFMSQIGND